MKLREYSLGLLLIFGLLNLNWLASSARANCVQADISVQYNISGSREPTERTNDVDLQSDGACRGNVSVTTGVQGNIGGNRRVRQTRRVRQRFANSAHDDNYAGKTIQIRSNPAIDVYNPADNLDY
ncbi:MAG: hypothetical protein AAF652_16145 [Cyanobacteria bacterium P01_C01_bin.72]